MMGTESSEELAFGSLPELVAWLRRAPSGTRLEALEVARILGDVAMESPPSHDNTTGRDQGQVEPPSWRERLWVAPAETRLGVGEVAEALGRAKSWVYAHTGPKADDPIPHRKLDGVNVFTAGELRAWIRDREEVVHGGPMHSTEAERRGLHAV